MKKKKGILILFLILFLGITGCGNKTEEQKLKNKTEEQKLKDKIENNNQTTCEEGYYLKDNKCLKIVEKIDATISYNCEKGYTLNDKDKTCTKTNTKNAKIDNPCPSGYNFKNGNCTKTDKTDITVDYQCPSGSTLNGSKCVGTTSTNALATKSCPAGYMEYLSSLSNCIRYTKASYNNRTGRYYCIDDYSSLKTLDDGKMVCVYFQYVIPMQTTYSCSSGTLDKDKCITEINQDAEKKVSCPSGYSISDNSCIKTETIKSTGKYYCESGYNLSGTKCTKTTTIDSTKKYSCSSEYELIDNKCFKFNNDTMSKTDK